MSAEATAVGIEPEILVNFRGHNGYPVKYIKLSTIRRFWGHEIEFAVKMFETRHDTSPELRKIFEGIPKTTYLNRCSVCGEPVSIEEAKAGSPRKVKATKKCAAPTGYPPFEVTINVPSGKLVVGNDFRELFSVNEDIIESVNSTIGVIQTVQAYEKVGLLHFLVGNSCPAVFQKGKNELCITRVWDKDTDEREVPGRGFKQVSWICTDLWWVCGMDYDLYKKLCKEKKLKVSDLSPSGVLDVKSGKWVFTYNPMEGCGFTKCFGKWTR